MTTTTKAGWTWTEPLPGTSVFPHHRRWSCREAIVGALRDRDDPKRAAWWIGRADAFNLIMYDCNDPLAWAYRRRIEKIRKLLDTLAPLTATERPAP